MAENSACREPFLISSNPVHSRIQTITLASKATAPMLKIPFEENARYVIAHRNAMECRKLLFSYS